MATNRPAVTVLDGFCLAHDIECGQLANAADLSRQFIARVRYAKCDSCIENAKKIACGASKIVRRKVPVAELFDLDFEVVL
jgi:hypothetical protein